MDYPPGTVFAGYTLKRVLGRGGMGVVYLAGHPRLPRDNALKLLSVDLSSDPGFRRRFELEAELAAKLQHPNIVAVNDRGDSGGVLWIDMQYVEGVDCSEALSHRSPMPPERALRIVTEVGRGLDYAHRRGLLHRDVKPANILLTASLDPDDDDERVLLTDFGLAKSVDATHRLTSSGSIIATLAYAAPEQVELAPLTTRTDVYALGAVLFELLTGRVPFPEQSAYAVMHAIVNSERPRATTFAPWLPPRLDEVIAVSMARRPEDRFASCTQFANAAWSAWREAHPRLPVAPSTTVLPRPVFTALAADPSIARQPRTDPVIKGQPPTDPVITAPPPADPPAHPRPRPRRGRLRRYTGRVLATLLATASLLAAFVVAGDGRQPTEPDAAVAGLPQAAELPLTTAIAVLDTGAGNLDLYLVDVPGGRTVDRLTTGPTSDRGPSLTPDRRSIAYLSVDGETGTLRVMASDGTGDRPLFPDGVAGCPNMGRPGWNRADPRVFVVVCADGERRSLTILSLTGEIVRTFDDTVDVPSDPSFSADGSTILYTESTTAGAQGGALYTVAADGSGEPVQLSDGGDGGASWSPDGDQIVFRRALEDGTPQGNFEIAVAAADGTDVRILAADPAQDSGPTWSPDGSQILFMSERTGDDSEPGDSHVFVMTADGDEVRQLLVQSGGQFGYGASWASR